MRNAEFGLWNSASKVKGDTGAESAEFQRNFARMFCGLLEAKVNYLLAKGI